jgi:hypothetical protein
MSTENKGLHFDRNQILNRYWELANLDTEETKGNILGQLKALDSLCEQLPAPPAEKPRQGPHAVSIYRSGWMKETSGRKQ